MKNIGIGIGIVLFVLVGYVLMQSLKKSTPMPTTIPTEQTKVNEGTASNAVSIKNFSFQPSVVTIKVGDTVTWKNDDSVPHAIKSADFSSQTLSNGDTYQFTFNTKGTFAYSCSIHPSMTGTVVVE